MTGPYFVGLAVALLAGCEFPTSSRRTFERSVMVPPDAPLVVPDAAVASAGDGGPDAPPADRAVAFRATSFAIDRPIGLAEFQESHVTPAVERSDLNFLVVTTEAGLLTGGQLPLRLGSGVLRGAAFGQLAAYPLAATSGRLSPDGALVSDPPVDFVVLARLPFPVPVPITGGKITARLGADRSLGDGLLTGVVNGESAATTLLDLQSDNDPSNDTPLIDLLGNADLDSDGDGALDSFSLSVRFASKIVELQP